VELYFIENDKTLYVSTRVLAKVLAEYSSSKLLSQHSPRYCLPPENHLGILWCLRQQTAAAALCRNCVFHSITSTHMPKLWSLHITH